MKYLSDHLGLAPEEAKPAAFEVERRLIDFKYTANADTERVCTSCHSIGRVMLAAPHRAGVEPADHHASRLVPARRQPGVPSSRPADTEPGADGRPPDNRHPYEKAVAHLKSAFPLTTPEWTAWSATMRSPRSSTGTWALEGYENGKGPIYGTGDDHGGRVA